MLELKNISKVFPGVKALDDVSVIFKEGEIHALLGENGAGKSTLIKIVCGIYRPDDGEVYLNGEKLNFHSFSDAISKGISIVNQEIQVIPESSIAENIMLDKMITYGKSGIVNWKKINEVAQKYLDMVGLNLPPTTVIGGLSAAQKQLVQIAKALASNARILFLDEPTSSITKHEADNLFEILRRLKENDVVIIFVSHKLEEVLELCDKVTVLRDGKYIDTRDTNGLSKNDIVRMMIGRETKNEFLGHLEPDFDEKVLEVNGLSQKGKFENISFSLHRGEILGFYGLVGSGRTELAKILIGEDRMDSGEVRVKGKKANINSVADCLYKYGIGYVSENRKEEGLILTATVKTNIAVTIWNQILNKLFKFINLKKEEERAEKMVDAMNIKVTSVDQITENLSGGNQQKVSIGKWLVAGCDILIIDEPTVGIDIGAKEYIHKLIWNLAKEEKKSIILISSDMPEMINLARRVLVFKDGKIVGEINDLHDRVYSYDEVSTNIGHYLA